MELILTDEQQMLVEGVGGIVSRYGGPARSRMLSARSAHDDELLGELATHGYLDVAKDPTAGPLEAILVVETVSAGLGTCSVGAAAVVAPLSGYAGAVTSGPLVLATRGQIDSGLPVRFGAADANVIVLDNEKASIHPIRSAELVERSWGYPLAKVAPGPAAVVLEEDASRAAAWWRLGLSAEIVACAAASLELTLAYLRQRHQFGRPLSSFQSLQHRLAQLLVAVEGARWLTYYAAWHGAPADRSLLCAVQAERAGRQAIRECHQLCGAQGLTVEFDLYLWTMRLSDLSAELKAVEILFPIDGTPWSAWAK
jgi:hypothetical protein